VRDGSAEFVLDGTAGAIEDQLQVAVGKPLDLAITGRARRRRRTWLDTFDWRLYRAGLSLQQVGTGAAAQLVLTGSDGTLLATGRLAGRRDGRPASWPSLVADLPGGQLRDLVAPVAGVRALAPVARAVSQVHEHRVLNPDAKTVAWITVDRMLASFPARAQLPPRVAVTAVRGYEAQARRIAATLCAGRGPDGAAAGAPGDDTQIRREALPALDAVLDAAGQRPAVRQQDVRLQAEMPAANAVAAILAGLLDAALSNVPGTIRDTDTEFLHDLRVAIRRTRAVLKLAGDALPEGVAARFAPEFRWLGDLTTPSRDLDVYLLGYPGMCASLQAGTPDELVPFHGYLTRARAQERQELLRGLRSVRFARLVRDWRAALAQVTADSAAPVAGRLAGRKIDLATRRALRAGRRVVPGSPAENLHSLRKRCKELRYLIEMFGPLYEPAQRTAAVRELKALQDCLGEFQDAEVQRDEIRAFAEAMFAERSVPAATLLALGEVSAGLAARQHQARSDFDARFAAFARPASQARLTALTRSARPQGAPTRAAA
jgi:CHAD domain-containing protein